MNQPLVSDQELLKQALEVSSMFSEASEATKEHVISVARIRTCRAGDTLFWENDPTGLIYIVCSGQIQIERLSDDGKMVMIATRTQGDVIGEVSLIEKVPRTADARVTQESKIAVIDGEVFIRCIREDGGFALGVVQGLANKLHQSIEHKVVQTWKLQRRLAKLLIELAEMGSTAVEGKGIVLEHCPTQEEMASQIACTREHVNRVLRQFRDEGIIELEGKTLVIRRMKLLKSISNKAE